jgi:hypothetical protein
MTKKDCRYSNALEYVRFGSNNRGISMLVSNHICLNVL